MTYRLYDFPASPFCIKIRAILDYKGVEFERIDTAGFGILELRRRGKIGKVPALDIDGELICDSTDIAHELERRHPTPRILPKDARQLAFCHALEDWADESLYWSGVYYRWIDPEGRAGAQRIFPKGVFGQTVIPAIVCRKAHKQLEGQGTGRKSPEHIARDLKRHIECLSQLLMNRDFLIEDTPMLCDFAVCGQLVYLRRTPHGAREIDGRPEIVEFVERMRSLRR